MTGEEIIMGIMRYYIFSHTRICFKEVSIKFNIGEGIKNNTLWFIM